MTIQHEFSTYIVPEIDVSGDQVADWKFWSDENSKEDLWIDDYIGTEKDVIIPISFNGKRVKGFAENAFAQCRAESVSIPGYYEKIPGYFGSNNQYIQSVTFGEGVREIGYFAFSGCTSLQDVTMPTKALQIGCNAFAGTPYLENNNDEFFIQSGTLIRYLGKEKDVVIPEGVTVLGAQSFARAKHVESITIGNQVQKIDEKIMGDDCWEQNTKLKKLVIGDSVVEIGSDAFQYNRSLTDIVFECSLRVIGSFAFFGCAKLQEIHLEHTKLTTIEQMAFAYTSLETVKLPKTVCRIGSSAFGNIRELIAYDTLECCNYADICGLPERNGRTEYYVTVLSAETDEIKYRLFFHGIECRKMIELLKYHYEKDRQFNFFDYDACFKNTTDVFCRTEMAFCRMLYPYQLDDNHYKDYEKYLERCMYIERSARRIANTIGKTDAVERLVLLNRYGSIDTHNAGWVQEEFTKCNAKECIKYMEQIKLDEEE